MQEPDVHAELRRAGPLVNRLARFGARRVAVAATAGVVALVTAIGAIAYFTATGSGSADASTGALSAATISAPTTSTGSATITWDVQASMTPASANSSITYDVQRKLGAGSYGSVASGPCSGALSYGTASCTDTVGASGTYTYRVVAHVASSWTSTSNEVTVSVNLDTAAPTTTVTFPLSGGIYNGVSFGAGCTPMGICGSASDTTGVDTVRVSVRRLSDGAYWDGSAYTGFSEFFLDAVLASPGATSASWSLALPLPGDGQYTVHVQAKDTAGNDSAPAYTSTATFTVDAAPPTQVVTMTVPVNAFLSAGTVYYRGSTTGSFKLADAVTDAGTGPASATFPDISTTGWTHAAETATTGTGSNPTKTYTSSTFSWTASPANPSGYAVTGADVAGNTVATSLAFANDSAAPTGGALTVNGGAATGGGSTTYYGTPSTISYGIARTDYTDGGSGLASSQLTREAASLTSGGIADGTCSGFGAPTILTGAPTQNAGAGITTGNCYRYTLTGTDNVGNTVSISTIVKVDTTAPSAPALVVSAATGSTAINGTIAYINAQAGKSGGFTVTATTTDSQSGIQKVNFASPAGFSSGGGDDTSSPYATTYAWSGAVAASGSQAVTSYNNAGVTAATNFSVAPDTTAPTGGAVTVNGTAASAGGSTSTDTDGSFTISGRTDYSEAQNATQSGLASGGSTLVRESATLSGNTCGSFGSPTTISSGTTSQSGLATACYRYTLSGVDNVGNTASISTIVKVDTSPPAFGSPALTLSASGSFAFYTGSGTSVYYNGNSGTSSSITVNASNVADPDSDIQSVTFPSPSGFGGGGVDSTSPYSTTYTWSSSSANGSQTVTATNGVANTSTTTFSLVRDVTAPAGGALTINGTAASGAGTTSNNSSGSFTIGTRTNYTESQSGTASGLASSTLIRTEAPLASDGSGNCGTFGNQVTITGTPTQDSGVGITTGNCYRYTLTGTDNVGNAANITTTVRVDTTAPTFGSPALTLSHTGAFAFTSGTTAYYNGNTGTASSITVSADNVSDPQSGIQKVNFPSLASFTGGGDDTASPYSTTYTWTSSSDSGTKNVTATNGLGTTATAPFSLVRDVAAPAGGGALTVNGMAASGAGTISSNTTGSFTIGIRTDYTETQSASQSGLASSTLVREQATLNADFTCGTFGSPQTIVGTPNQDGAAGIANGNCYRYTLTGTDNVSNAASVVTTVKVDTTVPTVTSVQLKNNGTAGRVEPNDQIIIQFSEQMAVSSFCPGQWSTDTNDQASSGNGVTITITDGTGGTNDSLTVTWSSCTGGLRFGTINLGSNAYISGGSVTFSGTGTGSRSTIDWTAATRTLTVKLGDQGGSGTTAVVASSNATYTPNASITDSAGNGGLAAKPTGNLQQF